MGEKKKVVETVMPTAALQAMTPEAIEAIPSVFLLGENLVALYHFPYRIGRESRVHRVDGKVRRAIRPKPSATVPNNDLYLIDPFLNINIAREHLQIEKHEDVFMLQDRGSAMGTSLIRQADGKVEKGNSFILHDQDIISIGTEGTPFLFKFFTLDQVKIVLPD